MTENKNIDSFNSAAEVLCTEIGSVVSLLPDNIKASVHEIRIRSDKPVALSDGSTTMFVSNNGRILYSMSENVFKASQKNIADTFRSICNYSVYSYRNEIKNGYITIRGGHRVGLCGTAVIKDGEISSINDISSLNIRIARQIFGVSESLISRLYPFEGGILIAGAPSTGKTTMLRDLAYRLSMGMGCRIMRTALIDERGELSGMYCGTAYNDIGLCDVLNGYPKGEGIMQAIRALSPQVIICDEVGTNEDVVSIAQGFNAGALIISTIHARSYDELMRRTQTEKLLETGAFRTVVILESSDRPCKISQIITQAQMSPTSKAAGISQNFSRENNTLLKP